MEIYFFIQILTADVDGILVEIARNYFIYILNLKNSKN